MRGMYFCRWDKGGYGFEKGSMDAVSMFQTQVKRVSSQVEQVCFENRGLAGLGGREGKQTNSGKKGLFAKQTFPSPGKRLVSGSGNKGFEPERFVFRPETFQRPAKKTKVSKL